MNNATKILRSAAEYAKRGRSSNNFTNMFTVAEDNEEDDDATSATLADFGLHQLADDDQYHHRSSHRPQHHMNGGYNAPLLQNEFGFEDDDTTIHHHHQSQQRQQYQYSHHDHMGTSINTNNTNEQHNDNNNTDNGNIGFIILKRLKLLPKNEGWALVSDLDLFFSSLYNYYYMRGLGSIIGKGVVELISLFFTLWLSLVLFAYIDWSGLSSCNDEETCKESFVEGYLIENPFMEGRHSFLRNAWIVVYCMLFSSYGVFCLIQFGHSVMASLESKMFLEEVLGVSDRDLEVGRVEWGEIVERMSDAQRDGRCRVAILPMDKQKHVDNNNNNNNNSTIIEDEGPTGHLVVSQRIMRRENFMIAFFNKGLLDLTLPQFPPWAWPLSAYTRRPKEEKQVFFSKSIEASIYFCVLNYMYNNSKKIRPAFYGDPSSLRRRFVLCGVAHAVFMPFLLFFVTLHFFMLNIYDWQSTKEYLGPREWSSVARWTFREFNELPHLFERRME
jgi:autophagy-related protein 9